MRVEPATKRIRIMLGGQVVADTTDAAYVWENPSYPQYYLPLRDVTPGALKETATTSHSAAVNAGFAKSGLFLGTGSAPRALAITRTSHPSSASFENGCRLGKTR